MIREYIFETDFEQLLKRKLSWVTKNTGVLNLACENHLIPDFLEGSVSKEKVFGLEINRTIVETVPNVLFCNIDTDVFPFPEDTFDLVVSIWGMEHFESTNVFQQVERALKPGGRFVFITPNLMQPAFLFNKFGGAGFGKFYYKHIMHSSYQPHLAPYSFNTFESIRKNSEKFSLTLEELSFFGPATFVNYFSFSKQVQKGVVFWEKIITNRYLGFLKPYLFVILQKKRA